MSRLGLCLFCCASLLALGGCDMMGPDDNLPPPRPRASTGPGPDAVLIRGKRATANPTTVVIDPNRHDVVTGVGNGTSGKWPNPTPAVDTEQTGGDSASSAGGSLFGEDDARRGMKAIGGEVAESLILKKTLVVWLLDKSSASVALRVVVSDGMSEIGRIAVQKSKADGADWPLSYAVVAYGKEVTMVTPAPTEDLSQAVNLVSGMGEDATDNPLTFTAVNKAAEEYLPYRNKGYEVLFVIVANKNGHDWDQLDEVIPKLVRVSVSVYGVAPAFRLAAPRGNRPKRFPRNRSPWSESTSPIRVGNRRPT